MDVLEKIKWLQKQKGWNNAQLADKAGLSPSTFNMLKKRNNQPSLTTLQALCKAFGITIAQFFVDSNVPLDLTDEQARLLGYWNTLNDEQKEVIFALLKTF